MNSRSSRSLWSIGIFLNLTVTGQVFNQAPQQLDPAPGAIDALGISVLQRTAGSGSNVFFSPYSIERGLAMAYAGADGATRDEMARVLHFPNEETALHSSFCELGKALEQMVRNSERVAQNVNIYNRRLDPVTLKLAERLFTESRYDFRSSFQALISEKYGAVFQPVDFAKDPSGAAKFINDWVEAETQQRIRGLISADGLSALTRLVLVDAIYLKAPWRHPFFEGSTKPGLFYVNGAKPADTWMMTMTENVAFAQRDGFCSLGLDFNAEGLRFLILLPKEINGLAALEKRTTTAMLLNSISVSDRQKVRLFMPRLKLEIRTFPLRDILMELGMTNAFDVPPGSANFDRMTVSRNKGDLYLSRVIHKTFLNLDEQGVEAVAVTGEEIASRYGLSAPQEPLEVRVDHPFIFAIMHQPTGTCLFLGRVMDPR